MAGEWPLARPDAPLIRACRHDTESASPKLKTILDSGSIGPTLTGVDAADRDQPGSIPRSDSPDHADDTATGHDHAHGGSPMARRIMMIIPVPVPDAALAGFAAQIPDGLRRPDVAIDFRCAARGGGALDSHYEGVMADAFCLDAGLGAEAEGYDAVCINSMSDSGVAGLRSRLSIPVMGTAAPTYHLACQLGRRFAIISMWDRWRWLYDKVLREQGLTDRLASIRSIGVPPDTAALLAGKEDSVFPALLAAARQAIDADGADVLVLGSTTMHQSHRYLQDRLDIPVLNPGLIALKTCEMLLDLGLRHSKRAYGSPRAFNDTVFHGPIETSAAARRKEAAP